MAGVLPDEILVHTATPLSYVEDPAAVTWIEGEPGSQGGGEPTQGKPFACVLFLPSPGGEQPNQYRTRVVRQPTLMYNPTRTLGRAGVVADGSAIVVRSEDELLIDAPEFAAWTGSEVVRWQAVGDAQPFGPPGEVLGLLATVRRVED